MSSSLYSQFYRYLQAKARHPGTLVLLRVDGPGSCVAFDEDAKVVASKLGIAPTLYTMAEGMRVLAIGVPDAAISFLVEICPIAVAGWDRIAPVRVLAVATCGDCKRLANAGTCRRTIYQGACGVPGAHPDRLAGDCPYAEARARAAPV